MTVRKGSVRSKKNVKHYSFLLLVATSMVYGGAHAAAWNTHLPTDVELLLWRISVALAAGAPLGMSFYLLSDGIEDPAEWERQVCRGQAASLCVSFF